MWRGRVHWVGEPGCHMLPQLPHPNPLLSPSGTPSMHLPSVSLSAAFLFLASTIAFSKACNMGMSSCKSKIFDAPQSSTAVLSALRSLLSHQNKPQPACPAHPSLLPPSSFLHHLAANFFAILAQVRARVYGWQYDAAQHGEEASCQPLQLLRVRARSREGGLSLIHI
eukprot:1835207-Rhodomonas_salina.1